MLYSGSSGFIFKDIKLRELIEALGYWRNQIQTYEREGEKTMKKNLIIHRANHKMKLGLIISIENQSEDETENPLQTRHSFRRRLF